MRIGSSKTFFILLCLLITATNNLLANDLVQQADTVKKTVTKKSFLEEKVIYSSKDSMSIDKLNEKAYLYNNAVVLYEDLKLTAGYIEIDFGNDLVHATSIKDSAGNDSQKPIFEQGEDKFTAGKISYNFNTKKGKISDVITAQGEGYIHGKNIKKDTNNTYYVAAGKYTTCDLEHPHFYIGASKIKVIPNEKIVTGPAHLYIADIPTPLVLPFGYFPNKKGRASGIIIPAYGEEVNRGFFLRDGGFYIGNNEYIDVALLGDIYSNGSFGLETKSNYKKRYRYGGNIDLSYDRLIQGDKELPNSIINSNFFVKWRHTQDPKAKPNSRFSADVNAGSNLYNRFNGAVNGNYLANTFQSNIAYSKTFPGTPFNFSANARHTQNTLTKKIDISLPELALNMNRIYPFKGKNSIKNKWYHKIGVSANANARNDINAYDSTLFRERTLYQMRNGVRINVPINTSFNLFKHLTVTPSINTGSSIYFETIEKRYDNVRPTFIDTVRGVKLANDYSFSTGLSTRLYGDYFFRTKRLKQIRHVMIPTVTGGYRPDFSKSKYGYYKTVKETGETYSIFQNGIYGSPSSGESASLGFNLNNTLEAKIKHQTDSGKVDKKVMIIESFNISANYNFAADSFQMSNININGRTKLFKVLDVNASANLDPYQLDSSGTKRIKDYEWNNGKIGRLTNGNIALGTSFRSKAKKSDNKNSKSAVATNDFDYLMTHPNVYVDFNVPWSLNIYYNINYSKIGLKETITQSINFNGDINLTNKWKIGVNSGYDFIMKKLSATSVNIYRDLHCWEMRFNWVPFGFRQSFSLDISVKASVLSDLKLRRNKSFTDNLSNDL